MSVYILDTETTGIGKSDQVIELAYLPLLPMMEEVDTLEYYFEGDMVSFMIDKLSYNVTESRYLSTCPINPHAQAVHNISRIDLTGKPLSSTINIPDDTVYIIGHSISFDKRMLGQSNLKLLQRLGDIKYICTLNLAKSISKHYGAHYENHKLDTLTKYYYPKHSDLFITPFHSAKNDVIKTLFVLLKLIQHLPKHIDSWDKLHNLQTTLKELK